MGSADNLRALKGELESGLRKLCKARSGPRGDDRICEKEVGSYKLHISVIR